MRKVKFINGEYYHIYNRGVDKRDVFLDEGDYLRFLRSMTEFNNNKVYGGLYRKFLKERESRGSASNLDSLNEVFRGSASNLEAEPLNDPLVEFIAYCLNPNHFHFILRQEIDDGVVKFMQRLGTAYTMYFNNKNNRNGVLFQGPFKAVKIDSDEHLVWAAAYVNGNAQIHGLIPDAAEYKWCSYSEYLGKKDLNICAKGEIIDKFKDIESFQKASEECFRKMKVRKNLQKYTFELFELGGGAASRFDLQFGGRTLK